MKKLFINLICFLLVFSLASCGEIVGPNDGIVIDPDNNNNGQGPKPDTPSGGEDTEAPDEFTVRLSYNGQPFIPTSPEIKAQWFDGFSYKQAEFDENGVARVSDLDGRYSVSLSALPEGYTYDPNIYTVTNDSPDTTIELHAITKPRADSGNGSNYFTSSINLIKTGFYRATIKKDGAVIFFRFIPPKSGTYFVRSLLDEGADNVNAILHYYPNSNPQYLGDPVKITGGASGFTTNFYFEINVDDSSISESGGRMEMAFAVEVDITDGEFPIYLDFELAYKDEFNVDDTHSNIMVPTELNKIDPSKHQYSSSQYVYTPAYMTIGGQNIFEDDFYKYNPDTGFYHLYDAEKYAADGGFGPILYAHITSSCLFLDEAFTGIEYRGNKALTVSNGTENYKLFIEGYSRLTYDPMQDNPQATTGPYLCDRYCPCRTSAACDGGCTLDCTKCLDSCRKVPAAAKGCVGYAGMVNSDGLCPVTEELKQFLQKFAVSQRYFIDGNGWVETQSDPPYHSGEDDQWLFACAYYLPKE